MKKSYKFGELSICHNGNYYFLGDIKPTDRTDKKSPYQTQVVFYANGKWLCDITYISEEFKTMLEAENGI